MSKRNAFLLGWLTARGLASVALYVANSDTRLGAEIRQKVLARMPEERLFRREAEAQDEIIRRGKIRKEKKRGDNKGSAKAAAA